MKIIEEDEGSYDDEEEGEHDDEVSQLGVGIAGHDSVSNVD